LRRQWRRYAHLTVAVAVAALCAPVARQWRRHAPLTVAVAVAAPLLVDRGAAPSGASDCRHRGGGIPRADCGAVAPSGASDRRHRGGRVPLHRHA